MSDPGFDPKWLPPSPHREAILAYLADGRAHVAEQGHGRPPLLVFEDGGAIELPRVRYTPAERGMELVAAETPEAPDQTKHRDVCGSLDELKARIAADPGQAATEREELCRLVRDVRHMLGRLQTRRAAYEAFAAALRKLAEAADAIDGPDPEPAFADCERLLERLAAADGRTLGADREALFALAEAIRDRANAMEKCLARHKGVATRLGALYKDVRGARQWDTPHP